MGLSERRQIAAILAGLRLLQSSRADAGPAGVNAHADAIDDIATSGGEFDALKADEIDELCMAINTGDVLLVTKVPA